MKLLSAARERPWTDEQLVRECRDGSQVAWSALIDKYKNLIFSIPIKFGLPREDAADIFQTVCAELLVGLPQLREPKALPKWLMQTTYHQCLRWKKSKITTADAGLDLKPDAEADGRELPEEMLYQVEREQSVREAITGLSPRCRRMVEMLFFEDPPRPYLEVARELKLAVGSIGFIRGMCLKKLRVRLEAKRFI